MSGFMSLWWGCNKISSVPLFSREIGCVIVLEFVFMLLEGYKTACGVNEDKTIWQLFL